MNNVRKQPTLRCCGNCKDFHIGFEMNYCDSSGNRSTYFLVPSDLCDDFKLKNEVN